MANLKNLSDENLWEHTIQITNEERHKTLEAIEAIREVKERRLHLKRGFSSLHEYCVKILKYSNGAADRRIKAMELVKALPEIKDSIDQGTLSLTTASQVQNFFRSENKVYSKEEKLELIHELKEKPSREVQKALATLNPEVLPKRESIRHITASHVKVQLVITEELLKKIEKLKNLGHKNQSVSQILEVLVTKELQRKDPELKKQRAPAPAPEQKSPLRQEVARTQKPTRYIPARTRHEVWRRDQGRCTFVDPRTQRRCEARRFLEIEHIHPFALGGNSEPKNLKLLCSNHNKLRAIQTFGIQQMARYLG